ncbi:MAG: LptF/LptG family permease [Magnetospiraceae bacterium]
MQLTLGLVLVTGALLAVIWLSQSLRFIEWIVNKGLTIGTFLYLTGLMVPEFMAVILPGALFIAVVVIYARLVSDRELVAMTNAGMSPLALGRPALLLAGAVLFLGFALNLYIAPRAYGAFKAFQWDLRYNYSHVLLQEGMFNEVSNKVAVYLRERSPDGDLLGILVHDTRDATKPATVMAERGVLAATENSARVILYKGNRQVLDKTTDALSVLYFDQYTLDLEETSSVLPNRKPESRELSVSQLFQLAEAEPPPGRNKGKYRTEAHNRLITPLQAPLYVLIALACLVCGDYTRRGQWRRIFLAAGLVIGQIGVHLALVNLAPKNLYLIPLLYVATLLPLVVTWFILYRGARNLRLTFFKGPRSEASGA